MSELKKTPVGLANGGTITGVLEIDDTTGEGLLVKKTGVTGSEHIAIQAPAEASLLLNSGVSGGGQPATVRFAVNNSQIGSLTGDGTDSNTIKLGAGNSSITAAKSIQLPQIGGMFGPRMTTTARQALSLNASHDGLEVYDLTLHKKTFWNSTAWEIVDSTLE